MANTQLTKIINLCLRIDENARDFYLKQSELSENSGLKDFWKHMSYDESEHIIFWKRLLELTEQGLFPQVFDDTDKIITELEDINLNVQNLISNKKNVSDVKSSFLIAYQIESHVLHRAFLSFFQFAKMFYAEKNIEDGYEIHIQEFIDGLNKFGGVTLELELLGKTLKQLWNQHKTLALSSYTDALTGSYNRRGFFNLVKPLSYLAQRSNFNIGIMMIDIDKFKKVNDTLGHLKGDEMLIHVAKIIKNHIRTSDILGRYGGEEFVIFLPSIEPNSLHNIADKIRAKVEKETKKYIRVTTSIGLSCGVMHDKIDEEIKKLINKADTCLYEAKKIGGNKVIMYNT